MLGMTVALLVGLLLIRLSPLEGAAFVGLLGLVIGALIEPFAGLSAALFLGPLKAYLSAEIPQIPAQIGHAFVALALASWLMRRLSGRETLEPQHADRTIVRAPLILSSIIFIGAVLVSLWDAVGLAAYGIPELIKWAELVLLVLFVKEHLASTVGQQWIFRSSHADTEAVGRRLRWLMAALLGTGVFQALVGIWQFRLRDEGPEHFRILGGDFFRAYGTFEQPNPYAGYLALTTALALGVALEATRGRWVEWYARAFDDADARQHSAGAADRQSISRPLYVLSGTAVGVMLVALVASWSRGAWMGFAAAVLVTVAAVPRKATWSVLLVAVLVVGGFGLYTSGSLPASFTTRLTAFAQDVRLEDVRGVPINDANYAVIERLAHWQAALSMFRYHPWTGVGFGCYESAYPSFALVNWPIALGHAHNIYLNMAAETGLLGLTAYLALWGVALWQTWRVTRRAQGLTRGLAIGLLGAWTHLSVHHLLDNLYVNNVHLHIGVLLGIAAFIVQRNGASEVDP
jgi:O-antigen ligase